MRKAVKLVEVFHEQREMFKEEQGRKKLFDQSIDKSIDKDYLLFQGSIVKGVKSLTRRSNQRTSMKGTRQKCEESFMIFSSAGLRRMETMIGKNGKEFMVFNKAHMLEISENPKILDAFVTLGINFSKYE